jgi:lipopolysaccharide/colanic/teichoic acid biosynthesis glycosyltransferase
MSFVGPRAGDWESVDTYLDDEKDKMKVLPGLTGYCQAYFRNNASVREKRRRDAWYANHVSFSLDMKILLRTIYTVIMRKDIYTN